METTPIMDHPRFDDTRIIISQILKLGNSIKRDISRIMSLSNITPSEHSIVLVQNAKRRILERLELVSRIRYQKKHPQQSPIKNHQDNNYIIQSNEQWNQILHGTLARVYKHSDSPEFWKLFQELIGNDEVDVTNTGIHFLQAYMRIVARIPNDKISLPFKP